MIFSVFFLHIFILSKNSKTDYFHKINDHYQDKHTSIILTPIELKIAANPWVKFAQQTLIS